jgi:hypothetical protein
MKSDNPVKHFLLAFVLALACYVLFYWGIEHRRNRKGPWQVVFEGEPARPPSLIIHQPFLAITNVRILFADEPSPGTNVTLDFRQPRQVPYPLPFGQCVFMDTTFLPGTVTLQMFGHEIELLPRVLIIDHKEYPWKSEQKISLTVPSTNPAPANLQRSQ